MRVRARVAAVVGAVVVGVLVLGAPAGAGASGPTAEGRAGSGKAIVHIDKVEVVPSADPAYPLGTTLRVTGWAIDPTSTGGDVLISGRTAGIDAEFGYSPETAELFSWRTIGHGAPYGGSIPRDDIPRPLVAQYGNDHGFDIVMSNHVPRPQLSPPMVTDRPGSVCLDVMNVIRDGSGGSTTTRHTEACRNVHLPRWAREGLAGPGA